MEPTEFEKPEVDVRDYRAFELSNGMKAIVVHDPGCLTGANKAAASLSLKVGRLHEPKAVPGLAHFCEHMLFLGTKKYPEESGYKDFAKKHGGKTNASTSDTNTTYQFDIDAGFLEPMLDRFSQFFIDPLLTKSAVDREVHAVDAEHQLKLTEDSRRLSAMLIQDANEKHLFHWGSGNVKTLKEDTEEKGIDLHTELLKFYGKFYSANLMSVCVVGKESVEDLEALVRKQFTPVADRQMTVLYGDQLEKQLGHPPFLQPSFSRQILYAPTKDVKRIRFEFLLPWQLPNWKTKPSGFLSHFLGHEGPGSILSVLKRQQVATGLSSYTASHYGCFSMLLLIVDVPHDDCFKSETVQLIGSTIFSYLNLLRTSFTQGEGVLMERLWRDEQKQKDIKFAYLNSMASYSLARSLAMKVNENESAYMNSALSASLKYFVYDARLIQETLSLLNVDNVRLTLVNKTFQDQCQEVDPWYQGRCSRSELDSSFRKSWETALSSKELVVSDLALPPENVYIPEDLSLRDQAFDKAYIERYLHGIADVEVGSLGKDAPVALKTGYEGSNCFWRPDYRFRQPKAKLAFRFYCPFVVDTIRNNVLTKLWCAAVEEVLNEETYDAHIAGLNVGISKALTGIQLQMSGFNDKIGVLLEKVMKTLHHLCSHPFDNSVFDTIYSKEVEMLQIQATKMRPYILGANHFQELTSGCLFRKTEMLQVMKEVKKEELDKLGNELFKNSFFEALFEGNIAPDECVEIVSAMVEQLALPSSTPPKAIPVETEAALPPGTTLFSVYDGLNVDDPNNAVRMYYQLESTLENQCMMYVLGQAIGAKFFASLRTKQQLGYIVGAAPSLSYCFVSLVFIVQTEYPVEYVLTKIVQFVDEFQQQCETGQQFGSDFETYKQAVLSQLRQEPRSVSMQFDRDWSEISTRKFQFHSRREKISCVQSLAVKSFLAWMKNLFTASPRLVVEVTSSNPNKERQQKKGAHLPVEWEPFKKERVITNETERVEFLRLIDWKSQNADLRPNFASNL